MPASEKSVRMQPGVLPLVARGEAGVAIDVYELLSMAWFQK
jgi:hypothetical protein